MKFEDPLKPFKSGIGEIDIRSGAGPAGKPEAEAAEKALEALKKTVRDVSDRVPEASFLAGLTGEQLRDLDYGMNLVGFSGTIGSLERITAENFKGVENALKSWLVAADDKTKRTALRKLAETLEDL